MTNPFTSKSASYGTALAPGEWEMQQPQILRQRKLAEALQQQADEPLQGQMVSGIYVKPSITQGLAKMAKALVAGQEMRDADEREKALATQMREAQTADLGRFMEAMQGTPATPATAADTPEDAGGYMPGMPARPGDPQAALRMMAQSSNPMLQQVGLNQMLAQLAPKKPLVVGRSLLDETGKVLGVDQTWQAEQQAAREQRKAEIEAKLADQQTSRAEAAALRRELAQQSNDLRREIAAQASGDRRLIAGMAAARQEQKNVPKLPTSALKMQQEELEAIGTAGAINADLGAIESQIDSGKLKLGAVSNLAAKAKNFVGASDESSRNLATFQATLEKLRNDSLRLNKGVQTEGDAQRAWNELVENINDPKLVKQRLGEIRKINERATGLRKMNIDAIRSNFGVDPMDTSAREVQPPAVGGGAPVSPVDALLKKYGG